MDMVMDYLRYYPDIYTLLPSVCRLFGKCESLDVSQTMDLHALSEG
jgi:hypothetical protein